MQKTEPAPVKKISGAASEQASSKTLETGKGFSDVISEKLSANNLAGEFLKFLRTLMIADRKYNLAVVAKSAKWV